VLKIDGGVWGKKVNYKGLYKPKQTTKGVHVTDPNHKGLGVIYLILIYTEHKISYIIEKIESSLYY